MPSGRSRSFLVSIPCSPAERSVFDARIEVSIKDVDKEVDQDEGEGDGEDGALDAIKAYAGTIDTVARRIEDALQPPAETVDGVHTVAA